MTTADVLGATLALIGLLLVALLVLPISVRAQGLAEGDRLWGELQATWAWGVVGATVAPGRREIALLGRPLSLSVLPGLTLRWRERHKSKAAERLKPRVRLAELPQHLRALRVLAVRVVSALHLRLTLEGIAGLDDPADTAVAHALVQSAARGMPDRVELAIEPDYFEARLQLRSRLSATVWPGELLLCLFWLLLRPDLRRTLVTLRS